MQATTPLHVKLDPQPAWARFEDIVVRLDTGALVAVGIETRAELRAGTFVIARARAVDADGATIMDAHGQAIASQVTHPYAETELKGAKLRVVDLQRDCVRAVLGEPTSHFFNDAEGAERRAKVSIRRKLAEAAASGGGPAADGS